MTMAEAIGHPNSLLSSNSSPSTLHSYRPSSEESIIVLSNFYDVRKCMVILMLILRQLFICPF